MRGVRFLPLALSALLLACRVATSDTAGESRHAFASLCAATNAAAGLKLTATKLLAKETLSHSGGELSSDAVKTALTTRGITEACWETVATAWWQRNTTGPWIAQLKHTVALAAKAEDARRTAARKASNLSQKAIYGDADEAVAAEFDKAEASGRNEPNTQGGKALAHEISYLCKTQVKSAQHACIVDSPGTPVTSGDDVFWAEYAKPLCMDNATPAAAADARAAIRNWVGTLATHKASAAIRGSTDFTIGTTNSVKIPLKGKKAVVAWRTSLEEAATAMDEAAENNTEAEGMLSQAVAQANAFCQHVAEEKEAKARGEQTRTAQRSMTGQRKQGDENEASQGETSIGNTQDRTEKQGTPEASREQRESTAPSRCRLASAVALAVGMALTPATLAMATLAPYEEGKGREETVKHENIAGRGQNQGLAKERERETEIA
ncbi:hypothetical protein, conserved in T. vivax [Trypanosoma vivax Y486]|uniref:Trypanosome variant surface glycoprotein B-type N-terminal domain-containing protein n=1 Tax=Trypanosoma vivax (strain Y486) TaxID=1055687 RepID=F9WTM0_TRYVY|nr:hypothetical protein, conserved in T. vivax [Trypanosoma vivax Y486]|eukprot:CCD20914.1 hypothetical protein, conserved in T. vivax [Trypanosoma vivax Y486]